MIGFFIFLIFAILATFCSARGSESWIKCGEDQKEDSNEEQTPLQGGSTAGQKTESLPTYNTPP